MSKLKTLMNSNRNLRFKTLEEMHKQYGEDWYDKFIGLDIEQCAFAMACYQGKEFSPFLVKEIYKDVFTYGPANIVMHTHFIIGSALPKYDTIGHIIYPNEIMTLEYAYRNDHFQHLSLDFRNEAGTVVQVLKTVRPFSSYWKGIHPRKVELDKLVVATTLERPRSGLPISEIDEMYGISVAFETSYHLRPATPKEKAYFAKTTLNKL